MKNIFHKALGSHIEFEERIFRIVLIVTGLVSTVGMLETVFIVETMGVILLLFAILAIMIFALVLTFKYRRTDIAAVIVGFTIIVIVFPTIFFICGGMKGGAMIWFVLGIFYVFLMFTKKRMIAFLILAVVVDLITYIIAYNNPDLIKGLPSDFDAYMDSVFSVILVGIAGGSVLKFQNKVFKDERAITLKQKEELEKVSNSKNVFFANMSHEIRTPINTIIGLNEMILREENNKSTRENAENIQIASKMLLNLVNDILDLSQLEIKRMEIVPVEYESKSLFTELVDIISVRMKEKKLEFFVDIDSSLPSVMMGDEKRITQIALNILTNAVKYTDAGSVTFSVRGEKTGDDTINIRMSVADTGIGIKKEDMQYLYDSFKRVDAKNNIRIEGSGLGLSITKQLVDLMGGEITVDSIYTKGSTFTVTLEQKIINPAPIGEINFAKRTYSDNGNYYRPSFESPEAKILVVDDNEMNLVVATKLLGATKVKIDTAKSGEECLEKTKKRYYDVILMDYMMPGLNGVDTLRSIRKQENGLCKDVPVIVLTANAVAGARQLYEEYGFDGYLEKPIQGSMLEKEVLKFLPEDIIEFRLEKDEEDEENHQIETVYTRKRKKVYITSDCACDLPIYFLDKYNIKLMYLYIKTDKGRFCDVKEMDSDNFLQYMKNSGGTAYADSASVEEYEDFFADTLTMAEQVIHISLAKNSGKSYKKAVTAAKGFDHVHVIDSGQISGGQALVVLYAAKLAMEGHSFSEICDAVEKMRLNVENCFMIPDAKLFYRNGYTNTLMYRICNRFRLHPIVTVKKSRTSIVGFRAGKLENAWKRQIRRYLHKSKKIDTDIIIITHVGCTVKQQEFIRNEVIKNIHFDRVIMQKASVTNACNAGIGTIGMAFYNKNE